MATSGSKDYSITRANIIDAALRKTGEFDAGDTVPGDETTAADFALNLMIKEWVARGIDIWLRDEVTLFLQPNQQSYAMGTANATTSYVETTTTAAEVTSATVIDVTSSTGMTAADIIGIKLDDDSIHWDTIATVDSSIQVTITTGIASAAASGNKVYAYTTTAGRPQKIISAFRRDINALDTQVSIIGETDYRSQSNKASEGPPVEIWYQPTLTTGTLYVWPVDGGKNWDKLVLSCQFLPDDFDSGADNPEFPIEFGNALVWGLAAELASEYGLPPKEVQYLEAKAEHKIDIMLNYDVENASVEFALDVRH